jgi:sigma-B regulation protein RsbU (phosphoserine phosphatase)
MTERPTILIIDDEPFNVDYLEQELEDLGYDTVSASNGLEGLQQVAQTNPDMILLDIMMPVMDGFEMLGKLKAEPDGRDIPVVIISAMSDMDSVVRGIQLGADDYLPKPFDPAMLKARLEAGLVRKRLRDLEKRYVHSLEKELEIGHRIQSGFLPESLPEIDGWGIAAHFKAAREVAGDFYDVFCLPDGKVGFFLGDVTDKGVGSALFMALYRSLLRAFFMDDLSALATVEDECARLLLHTVRRTNQYVSETHERPLYATLLIGILNPQTGSIRYINAGHNPPAILKPDNSRIDLKPTGPFIGMAADLEYTVALAELGEGDALFIYSDGVEDTENDNGEFFGRECMIELLATSPQSAHELVERFSSTLDSFMGEAKPFDDVTVLVIMKQ